MPLSRLYETTSLGFDVAVEINKLQEQLFLFSSDNTIITNLLTVTQNGLASANGIGFGNGYIILNIFNVGPSNNKQIYMASYCTFLSDINSIAFQAWKAVRANIAVNQIAEGDIIKVSLIGVQTGNPKKDIEIGQLLFIAVIEPR